MNKWVIAIIGLVLGYVAHTHNQDIQRQKLNIKAQELKIKEAKNIKHIKEWEQHQRDKLEAKKELFRNKWNNNN